MRTAVNRVLLFLGGLLLLAVGLLVLIGGLDLRNRWGWNLPSWWPLDNPDQPLLSAQTRAGWKENGWFWPVVVAGLAILALMSLGWLLAQLGTRRLARVRVPAPGGGDEAARLSARALEDALAAEVGALEGVERARVRLHGRPGAPQASITVTLGAHASPAFLADRIDNKALENARRSTGLSVLPAGIRLRTGRYRATRVE